MTAGQTRHVCVGLVAWAMLMGCSAPTGPQVPVEGGPAAREQASGPDQPVPGAGGTLRIGLGIEPVSLDPRFVVDLEGELVVGAVFEPLVRLDDRQRIVAAAAHSWTIDDAGTTYRFELRNAFFHDGSPVTAYDFKRTFDSIADGSAVPASPLRDLVEGIVGARTSGSVGGGLSGVQIESDEVLTIRLEEPDVAFMTRLAHPSLGPLPVAASDDPEAFAEQPIGNGPFMMVEPRTRGAFIRLTADPDHHRQPKLDEVLVTFYLDDPSATRQWQDLASGALHVTRVTPSRFDEAVATFGMSPDGYTGPGLLNGVTTTIYAYAFDVTRPPFDDRDARVAWSLAIDRDRLADGVMRGSRAAASSLVPPSIPGHQANVCDACRRDPELAAALWEAALARWTADGEAAGAGRDDPGEHEEATPPGAQAGGDDDLEAPPTITLYHPRGASHAAIAEQMAADLESTLRVRIILRAHNLDRFVAAVRNGEAQVFRLGWEPSEPDPGAYLAPLLHSRELERFNLTGWSSPEVDALLDDARRSTSLGAAMVRYREAERLMLDAMPVMPLLYYRHSAVVSDAVEGFTWEPTGRIDLTRVSLRP